MKIVRVVQCKSCLPSYGYQNFNIKTLGQEFSKGPWVFSGEA